MSKEQTDWVRAADVALALRDAGLLSRDGTFAQGSVGDFVKAIRSLPSPSPAGGVQGVTDEMVAADRPHHQPQRMAIATLGQPRNLAGPLPMNHHKGRVSEERSVENTDRHLWREPSFDSAGDLDLSAPSIHVTEGFGVGINVGGNVVVMPLRDWHALALSRRAAEGGAVAWVSPVWLDRVAEGDGIDAVLWRQPAADGSRVPLFAAPVTVTDELAELAKHPGWSIERGYRDNDEEGDYGWCVHEVFGGRNDRDWRLIGFGETPRDALRAALSSQAQTTGGVEP